MFVDADELPVDLRGVALAAPFDPDPAHWLEAEYLNLHEAGSRRYRITTTRPDPDVGDDGSGRVLIGTYGDVVRALPRHPESKSLGPDGLVCGPETRGLLERRTVTLVRPEHIGKESTTDPDDGLIGRRSRLKVWREQAADVQVDEWEGRWLPLLRGQSTRAVAAGVGVDTSTVKRWKTGDMKPHPRMRARAVSWLQQRASGTP